MTVRIRKAGAQEDWTALRRFIADIFVFMDGRIDPPSSIHRWTAKTCAEEARAGLRFLAERPTLIGCLFARPMQDALHLSKIAVAETHRGQGIASALLGAAESEACDRGLRALMLSSRVELTETHAAFAALGFSVVGQTSHPGYERPTSLTMLKRIGDSG